MQLAINNVRVQPFLPQQQYVGSSELLIANKLNGLVCADVTLTVGRYTFDRDDVGLFEFYNELLSACSDALFLERRSSIILDGEPFCSIIAQSNSITFMIAESNAASPEGEIVEVPVVRHWLSQCRDVLRAAVVEHGATLEGLYREKPTAPLFEMLRLIGEKRGLDRQSVFAR